MKAGKLTVIFQVRKFSTFPGFIFEDSHFGNNTALTSVANQFMKEDSRIEPGWS